METLQTRDFSKILDCRLLKVLDGNDQMLISFPKERVSSGKVFNWLLFSSQRSFNHKEGLIKWHLEDSLIFKPLEPFVIEKGEKLLCGCVVSKQVNDGFRCMLQVSQKDLLSVESFLLLGLSKREAEVFFKVIQGKENLEISSELNVSLPTVKKHLENIYRKFNVISRCAAVLKVLKLLGILSCE